jgi:hypothetical protein
MDRAVDNHERFIVDRRGEPAVVIMSVQDFINAVAPASCPVKPRRSITPAVIQIRVLAAAIIAKSLLAEANDNVLFRSLFAFASGEVLGHLSKTSISRQAS